MDLFTSILVTDAASVSIGSFLICTLVSLVLGLLVALQYMYRSAYKKNFVITLALMPAIVQMVIMLVNGNLGTGVAVMGAFSLVRFRSVPGSSKEITSIFLVMAVGLATGMGYLAIAALFVIVIGLVNIAYNSLSFGEQTANARDLKIMIPESLDYSDIFEDLFQKYTRSSELQEVRTANMGSLYKLNYRITIKDPNQEKKFIDELRCRNGNLEISCCRAAYGKEEL